MNFGLTTLELHLIPQDPSLWELDRFEDFIRVRKALIEEKFEYMLQKSEEVTA